MSEILYSIDSEVASFPYHFEIRKEKDDYIGEVTAYIWKDLKVPSDQKEELQNNLRQIPAQENSGFFLENNEIRYHSWKKLPENFDDHDEEVDIRRHFIEDYLEAVRDLKKYAGAFEGVSEKTEFLN